jgi:uncharacterized protein
MCLLCDHMLGTLVTWLRCLGYDTIYASDVLSDNDILKQAQSQNRILITRDKQLLLQAEKQHISTIPIQSDTLQQQIQTVLRQRCCDTTKILSRCLQCNTILVKKDKAEAKGVVPSKIYERFTQFWYCPTCHQFFWHGTHYIDMKQRINRILASVDC